MDRRKRFAAVAAVAVLAAACVVPSEPTPPQQVNVCGGQGSCGGNVGQPSPTPGPSASPTPGSCPSVAQVTVAFVSDPPGRITTRVGQREVLDATPRTGSRDEVPAACHGTSVAWEITLQNGARCAMAGETSGFNPQIQCDQPGAFQACATVAPGGPPQGGRGCTTFTVNP